MCVHNVQQESYPSTTCVEVVQEPECLAWFEKARKMLSRKRRLQVQRSQPLRQMQRGMPVSYNDRKPLIKNTNVHAVTELMNTKRKASESPTSKQNGKKPHHQNTASSFNGRDGLGAYIKNPEKYDSNVVIYHNSDFVVIHDLYPKSSIHTLILPRSAKHNYIHPFEAFEDAEFLELCRAELKKVEALVAAELQRRYGRYSKEDEELEKVLNGEVDIPNDQPLPVGRDWSKDVMSGVHAHPSMNHLHIHIMSKDRYSDCLNHRKHYNSFNTAFFVPLRDFPLAKDDPRRDPGKAGYLKEDFKCWRCGKMFGNQFTKLKAHLAEEFDEWKRV